MKIGLKLNLSKLTQALALHADTSLKQLQGAGHVPLMITYCKSFYGRAVNVAAPVLYTRVLNCGDSET